jgi:hypothetical protein
MDGKLRATAFTPEERSPVPIGLENGLVPELEKRKMSARARNCFRISFLSVP